MKCNVSEKNRAAGELQVSVYPPKRQSANAAMSVARMTAPHSQARAIGVRHCESMDLLCHCTLAMRQAGRGGGSGHLTDGDENCFGRTVMLLNDNSRKIRERS
jgi:hypothetical protein